MIRNIRHRGLRRLYEVGDSRGVPGDLILRLRIILAALEGAHDVRGMNKVGYYLHPLRGDLKGFWSVRVSGNWRIIFRFDHANKEFYDVLLIDYH